MVSVKGFSVEIPAVNVVIVEYGVVFGRGVSRAVDCDRRIFGEAADSFNVAVRVENKFYCGIFGKIFNRESFAVDLESTVARENFNGRGVSAERNFLSVEQFDFARRNFD